MLRNTVFVHGLHLKNNNRSCSEHPCCGDSIIIGFIFLIFYFSSLISFKECVIINELNDEENCVEAVS